MGGRGQRKPQGLAISPYDLRPSRVTLPEARAVVFVQLCSRLGFESQVSTCLQQSCWGLACMHAWVFQPTEQFYFNQFNGMFLKRWKHCLGTWWKGFKGVMSVLIWSWEGRVFFFNLAPKNAQCFPPCYCLIYPFVFIKLYSTNHKLKMGIKYAQKKTHKEFQAIYHYFKVKLSSFKLTVLF